MKCIYFDATVENLCTAPNIRQNSGHRQSICVSSNERVLRNASSYIYSTRLDIPLIMISAIGMYCSAYSL